MRKAKITFPTRDLAKAFAVAWSRHTLKGHTVSSQQPDGSGYVVLDSVTDAEAEWIEEVMPMFGDWEVSNT